MNTEQYLKDLSTLINNNLALNRLWESLAEVQNDPRIERANRLLLPFKKELEIIYNKCPCKHKRCGANWKIKII